MNHRHNKSITLLELLIAITLLSVIVLGFTSIDLFSHFHVLTSDRRAKVQNEASFVLDHMTKEIAKAIGNERVYGNNTVIKRNNIDGDTAIWAYIDYNRDGKRNSGDRWIAYRFTGITENDAFQIQYCPECINQQTCATCSPFWGTEAYILSKKITNFTTDYISSNNYVDIDLTSCADPDGTPWSCNTSDNPNVRMQNRIKMLSVSTN